MSGNSILTPVQGLRQNRFYTGRPMMQTTYQMLATIRPQTGQTPEGVCAAAIETILAWAKRRSPCPLPAPAWQGHDFDCGVPGNRLECAAIPGEGLWSLRLTHPDAPHGDHEAVPGRTWTIDLALQRLDSCVRFAIRVYCTSQPYCTKDVSLTRPRVILALARRFWLESVRRIDGQPWYLNTCHDLDAFYALLVSDARVLPVYLLTKADPRRFDVPISPYLVDERYLAQQTQGLAYVAVLPQRMSFEWTNRVGKVWSAFHGAARTYRPGLDFERDSPIEHPLTMANKILFWRHGNVYSEKAFAAFLIDHAYQDAASRRLDWAGCLFYTDMRQRQAELARQEATEQADWRAIYDAQLSALQAKIKEIEKERDEALGLAEQAEKERNLYVEQNAQLRWQTDSLRDRLTQKTGENPDTAIEIPDDYEELPEWVGRHLAGRLVLHTRALRGLKNAAYEGVGLVYGSLLLLANEYRNMRLGLDGAKKLFDERLKELELRYSQSISQARAGEEGDTYFVRYPPHTSRRQFLEFHLRKGSTKDDRHCMAVYFFWDEETRQVVVGWLPSHLDNRMT